MMKSQIANQQHRRGFTLVELLVSISIFVILLTIVIGAVDLTSGNRGLASGANQLQSAIEGARSRAAKMQRNVGLRFMLNDRVDNSAASTEVANTSYIEYVSTPEPVVCRVTISDTTPANLYDNPYAVTLAGPFVDPNVRTQMADSGLFNRGVKIQLYESDPNNPTIVKTDYGTYQFTEASNPLTNVFYINPPLKINDTVFNVPASMSLFGKIIFEAMVPLPNEQPIQLAKDVVIDWKSSKPPREWKMIQNNAVWEPDRRYVSGMWVYEDDRYFKCIDSGLSGTSTNEPVWSSVVDFRVVRDNTVLWQAYPQPSFELLFNPRGDIEGSIASNGVIHFVLASKDDVLKGISLKGRPATIPIDADADGNLDFEKEHRILTLFTQTGYTAISLVNLKDTLINSDNPSPSGPPDGWADDPYRYALEGVEAK